MKIWLLVLLPLLLGAALLQEGDPVGQHLLRDQFDKEHKIGSERYWVIAWDRGTTRTANLFFEKHSTLLTQKRAALLVDVSQTPAGIMSLFVMPRMQSYDHPILLSYDEAYNLTLPYKEEMLTVLTLKKGRIEAVEFAAGEEELGQLLKEPF